MSVKSNVQTMADGLAATGRAALTYIDAANADHPVILNTYRAVNYVLGNPVVLVQHGVMRNGDDYRDFRIPAADKHGLLIVASTFSDEHWPGLQSYNNGRVRLVDSLLDASPEALQSDAINWTLRDVPHIGHNGDAMSVVAASLWFDGVMPDNATLARLAADQIA